MTKGGKRPGAGRKKGSLASHTIEASEARKALISRVNEHIEPIVKALIKRAEKGDVRAAHLLFDRVFGRSTIEVAQAEEHPLPTIVIYGENDHLKTVLEKRYKLSPIVKPLS